MKVDLNPVFDALCGGSSISNDILAVTQLITVFEVFDSEDEAVRSFT